MENKDHDLLIDLSARFDTKMGHIDNKMNSVCIRLDKIDEKFTTFPCVEQKEKCEVHFNEIKEKIERRPKKGAVFGFYAAVISVLIAVFGMFYMNDKDHDKSILYLNKKTVQIEETLDNHIHSP